MFRSQSVGIDGLGELQVNGTAGGNIQLPLAFDSQASLRAQVGVLADDVERIKTDSRVGERSVDAALVLEVNARTVTASSCRRASPRNSSGLAKGPATVTVPAARIRR